MATMVRPETGGFLRPFGLGMFILAYLSGDHAYGDCVKDPERGAPTEDIRSAYKKAILKAHAEDMVAMALERGIDLSLEEVFSNIVRHGFADRKRHEIAVRLTVRRGSVEVRIETCPRDTARRRRSSR